MPLPSRSAPVRDRRCPAELDRRSRVAVARRGRPRHWPAADDDALVRAIRAGDEAAFAELARRYGPRLLRHAGDILGHRHRALDDVVQDALHRAHDALRSREVRPLRLSSWLYRIVHNRSIDELRRDRHELWAPEALEVIGPHATDVAAEVAARQALRQAIADIALLPPRQRAALIAVAVDGRSHEELAAELDVSVQASKALVSRARGRLLELRATS